MSDPDIGYMAHAVSAPTVDGIWANLARAERWLWWLRKSYPEMTIIAPWIVDVRLALTHDGTETPAARAAGLRDCERIAAHCGKIFLVGGTLTNGMARERNVVLAETCGKGVIDLLYLGTEPPEVAS